jgi:shikimate dehydrogenase
VNEKKLLVGLIGAGIQRSLTPAMQEEEARAQGLRLHYQLIDLDNSGQGTDAALQALPTLISAAKTMGFAGLNITYPCKQAVIALLDDLSDEARAMGAVNTVVFKDGKATGHNTDGSGWRWGFERALPDANLSRVVLDRRSRIRSAA